MPDKTGSWGWTCFKCLFKAVDCGSVDELQQHVATHRRYC